MRDELWDVLLGGMPAPKNTIVPTFDDGTGKCLIFIVTKGYSQWLGILKPFILRRFYSIGRGEKNANEINLSSSTECTDRTV
jgi:hypothetical protein